jgi:hypothetical protein
MASHVEKIKILTRLIKEDKVTLEEALTLLEDENLSDESLKSKELKFDTKRWCSSNTNHFVYFDDTNSN